MARGNFNIYVCIGDIPNDCTITSKKEAIVGINWLTVITETIIICTICIRDIRLSMIQKSLHCAFQCS